MSQVVDNKHYGTWNEPTENNILGPDILDGIQTVDHVITSGDRLDLISKKYCGDEEYWWIIALVNRIADPFSLTAGQTLKVPTDIKPILNKIDR
jgi:nucleoid-associated protein YgaU